MLFCSRFADHGLELLARLYGRREAKAVARLCKDSDHQDTTRFCKFVTKTLLRTIMAQGFLPGRKLLADENRLEGLSEWWDRAQETNTHLRVARNMIFRYGLMPDLLTLAVHNYSNATRRLSYKGLSALMILEGKVKYGRQLLSGIQDMDTEAPLFRKLDEMGTFAHRCADGHGGTRDGMHEYTVNLDIATYTMGTSNARTMTSAAANNEALYGASAGMTELKKSYQQVEEEGEAANGGGDDDAIVLRAGDRFRVKHNAKTSIGVHERRGQYGLVVSYEAGKRFFRGIYEETPGDVRMVAANIVVVVSNRSGECPPLPREETMTAAERVNAMRDLDAVLEIYKMKCFSVDVTQTALIAMLSASEEKLNVKETFFSDHRRTFPLTKGAVEFIDSQQSVLPSGRVQRKWNLRQFKMEIGKIIRDPGKHSCYLVGRRGVEGWTAIKEAYRKRISAMAQDDIDSAQDLRQ
eukprot:g1422.t1